MSKNQKYYMTKVDILAIGVHPDDVELSCSGTILKHIAQGKTVGLLDLTRGELGTRGSAEIRTKEANTSAKLMGAKFRVNLDMADGFFKNTQENQLKIIQIIRSCQPDIILANALDDRHPDHGRAAKLVHDACFLSGLVKVSTKDGDDNLQDRWRPKAVYHYIQDAQLDSDFVVDISPYLEKKMELILSFRSQFFDPSNDSELDSPISGEDFLEFIKAKGRTLGRPIGVSYAEGFNVTRTMGVGDLFDLI